MSTTDVSTQTLFTQVLEVPPDERAAFLDEHCSDPERRADVASLLAAYDEAGSFFENLRAGVSAPAVGGSYPSAPTGSESGPWTVSADPLGLEGTDVAGYAVQEHIGGGGMGIVYRAWDPRLERSVALKFLPPFLAAAPSARRRFVQEARAAGRLEHPNVATIHEIEKTDAGRRFIVMTHYDGETLRTRMSREGPFEAAVAVEYVQTLAEALHQIHEAGIVHRDVKPANVMITAQGTMKLLDFGLSRAAATGVSVSDRRLGTPSYMSPEQAQGTETGPPTDLWALGVILYELLTGTRPFSGDRPRDILESVCDASPPSVRTQRPAVPRALASIVETCLQKDPSDRYASAQTLATDLGALEIDPQTDRTRSIAILPFTSQGTDAPPVLADGMHESILAQLATVSDLKVTVGSAQDRDDGATLSSMADAFGTRWILTGRVRRANDQLQVTARLFDARAGDSVWADTYHPTLTAEHLFDVQERITQEIAEALTAQVTPGEQERIANTPTQNLDAYRLYVKGRSNLSRRDDESVRNAVEYFRKAVGEDPTYALAWAGLADAVNVFPLYVPDDYESPEVDAEHAARRALELAPDLAEAHASLGYLQDPPEGTRRLRHAITLKPSYAQAHTWLGLKLLVKGALEEARNHATIAAELAPRNRAIQSFFSCYKIAAGQYEEGIARIKQLTGELETEAEWGVQAVSRFTFAALYAMNQWEEARGLVEQRRERVEKPKWVNEWIAKGGMVEAALGNREAARRRADRLAGQPGALYRGLLLTALGDHDAAYEAFQSTDTWGYFEIMEFRHCYPDLLAPLRHSDRYDDLLTTIRERRANPTAAYYAMDRSA